MGVFKSKYGHRDWVWAVDGCDYCLYSGSVASVTFYQDGVVDYEVCLDESDEGDLALYTENRLFTTQAEAEACLKELIDTKRERDIYHQKMHIRDLERKLEKAKEDLKELEK